MRVRRLRKHPAELEITAFLNLIVVLVPFLLSTAVFSRMAVLDLTLPKQSSGVEQLKVDELKLEVVIRRDAIEVSDRIGGLIERIADKPTGRDVQALNELLRQLKARFPAQTAASILAEPETPYDTLVHVMDAVRAGRSTADAQGGVHVEELFPAIAVGDAPVVRVASAANGAVPVSRAIKGTP